jgi:hypothetical protein
MSKNKANHTPRKPRPSEIAAKKAKEAAKAKPAKRPVGHPPTEGTAFDKTTMVRMFKADYLKFEQAAAVLAAKSGSSPSVGAFLRVAGRAMLAEMGIS